MASLSWPRAAERAMLPAIFVLAALGGATLWVYAGGQGSARGASALLRQDGAALLDASCKLWAAQQPQRAHVAAAAADSYARLGAGAAQLSAPLGEEAPSAAQPPRAPRLSVAAASSRGASAIAATFPDGVTRAIPLTEAWIDSWWLDTFPSWHAETLELFYGYLSRGHFSTYVGFGEWIGPTAIFASSYVARAFAIEPDPIARRFLLANVAANPAVAAAVHVSALCIAPTAGTLTMRGVGASGSWVDGLVKRDDAGIKAFAEARPDAVFEVPCVPLGLYVAEHAIDLSRTFMKIDCEGAEWNLLPSLIALVAALPPGRRPTLVISQHAAELREASLPALLELVRLFAYAQPWASFADGQLPVASAAAAMTLEALRKAGDGGVDVICSDWTAPPLTL